MEPDAATRLDHVARKRERDLPHPAARAGVRLRQRIEGLGAVALGNERDRRHGTGAGDAQERERAVGQVLAVLDREGVVRLRLRAPVAALAPKAGNQVGTSTEGDPDLDRPFVHAALEPPGPRSDAQTGVAAALVEAGRRLALRALVEMDGR